MISDNLNCLSEEQLDALQEYLDDLIIDIQSQIASDINNRGIEGQLDYLQEDLGWTDKDVREELRGLNLDLGLHDLLVQIDCSTEEEQTRIHQLLIKWVDDNHYARIHGLYDDIDNIIGLMSYDGISSTLIRTYLELEPLDG